MAAVEEVLTTLRHSCAAVVAGTAVVWTLWRRTPQDLLTLVGAFACAAVNKVLKMAINQPRPARSTKEGSGMPSSHACLLAYWFVVVALGSRPPVLPSASWTLLVGAMAVYELLVVYASVEVTYEHSWAQVSAGLALGTVFASTWLRLVQIALGLWRS